VIGQLEVDAALLDYVRRTSLREPDLLRDVREQTARLPQRNLQISAEQGQFLGLLVKALGARRVLEVGVFTGYSLLSMAMALPVDGTVVACEIDRRWAALALDHCRDAGVADRVDLRLGDARATLARMAEEPDLAGSFDLAFIDADKTGYRQYYEHALALLRPGGLIVVDNVLWSGRVVGDDEGDPDTEALRDFNRTVHSDPRVDISMLPAYDGLTLAVKR
jgi:predicted O-methyltransferase YrrM